MMEEISLELGEGEKGGRKEVEMLEAGARMRR